MNKERATVIGIFEIIAIEWYVPHYTTSILQQAILYKQILSKTTTELQYVQRCVFMKEVNTQNLWTFELWTQEDVSVPIWNIVGETDRIHKL